MKIKSLNTTGFGKFKSENSWNDFSDNINVFYGENEAGKSTIFEMIISLLFGISPANREKNKYVNRSNEILNLSGDIFSNEKNHYLHRQLRSKANLEMITNSDKFIFENIVFPEITHINRDTYKEIYALELSRLINFRDTTWEEIENMLLNHYSGDTVFTPKEVLDNISNDLNKIKRKSQRGNSTIKTLEEKRQELFKKKRNFQEKISKSEDLKINLEYITKDIQNNKSDKIKLEDQLKRLRKYSPIMDLYNEKKIVEGKLLKNESILKVDEIEYFKKKEELKKLYLDMDDLSVKISKLVNEKRSNIEMSKIYNIIENELQEKIDEYKELTNLVNITDELEKKQELKRASFKKEFENTFSEPFKNNHFNEVLNINHLNVKSFISEIEELNEEIKILKRNKRSSNTSNIGSKISMMIFIIVLGVAVNIYEFNVYNDIINKIGMFFTGLSFIKIIDLLIRKKNKLVDENEILSEREDIKKRLLSELNGIKLSYIVEEFIGKEFLTQLINLKNNSEIFLELELDLEVKKERKDTLLESLPRYVKKHLGTFNNMQVSLDELTKKVEENKKYKSNVEIINGKLDLLNSQMEELEKNLSFDEKYLYSVESLIKSVGDDSLEKGLDELKSIRGLKEKNNELDKKIKLFDFSYKELKLFIDEFLESDFFNENYLINEVDNINISINNKLIEKTSIEKDIKNLIENIDLSDVKGEILYIDNCIKEEQYEYDRLQLLYYIVKKSDDMYKNENQSDVFSIAGKYLDIITESKYNKLEVITSKDNKKINEIYLESENKKIRVDSSFSEGTLNQIQFALRLALIDQLDKGYEKLPICFDELLVNWDRNRLDRTIKIIEKISKDRQVFIFTCHDWFVEAIEKNMNSKVYIL